MDQFLQEKSFLDKLFLFKINETEDRLKNMYFSGSKITQSSGVKITQSSGVKNTLCNRWKITYFSELFKDYAIKWIKEYAN